MKQRLAAAAVLGLSATLALAACSSSSKSSSSGGSASGAVTIKLVAADYGTGAVATPARSTGRASPTTSTRRTRRSPSRCRPSTGTTSTTKVQTMVQNKQYPDVLEGDYFADYAQDGLLYKARTSSTTPTLSASPDLRQADELNGTQYGMPFTTSVAHAVLQQEAVHRRPGSPPRRRPGRTSRPTRRRSRRRQDRLRAAARLRGGSGRVAAVVPRQRRQLPDGSGKWAINSSAERRDLRSS